MSKPSIKHLWSFINKISKRPAVASYQWDERASIVAFVLFYAVTVVRFFSLLQWLKFFHRNFYGRERNFQKRTNFHAQYTEGYFIGVIALLITFSYLGSASPEWLKAIIGYYFAAESIMWVAYYLFFRHFVEINFTIYNNAEYFLALPLVLAVQLLGLALATSAPDQADLFSNAARLLGFIFNVDLGFSNTPIANENIPPAISGSLKILGVFYVVIVLSNLRDAFPKTQIKAITSTAVVGAGDVVCNRLLPALINPLKAPNNGASRNRRFQPVEIHHRSILLFDLGSPGTQPTHLSIQTAELHDQRHCRDIPIKREQSSQNIVVELVAAKVPTIVATPPDSHFFYITMLALHGIRFAVEKPITVFAPEIRTLEKEGEELFADGFAMSYYALEKALPLTYLFTMHPMHRTHLDFFVAKAGQKNPREVDAFPWNEIVGKLGTPNRITVFLLEGMARSPSHDSTQRQWTENPALGGLFYETAIHAITVLHKIMGDLDQFIPKFDSRVYDHAVQPNAASFVHISRLADSQEAAAKPEIDLFVGKYMPAKLCARGVLIEYQSATVCCDFDTMTLRIRPTSGSFPESDISEATIAVCEQYKNVRYGVQTSLIRAFFEYGWQGIRFDDFATQCAVLTWLNNHRAAIRDAEHATTSYYATGNGLPIALTSRLSNYLQQRPDLRGDSAQ